jgi:hypothetical protein
MDLLLYPSTNDAIDEDRPTPKRCFGKLPPTRGAITLAMALKPDTIGAHKIYAYPP